MTTIAPGKGDLPTPERYARSLSRSKPWRGRLSLEDKLAAIRAIRDAEPSESHKTELKRHLGDRSNLVVATAATLAGERAPLELAGDMEAAFDRFLIDPVKSDKLCRAKIAIVQALDKIEHLKRDIFEKAARHIQREPAFGPPVDTAAPLRGAALFALARIGGSDYHCLLVDAFTDPEKDVRIAAAQALAYVGTEAAGLVLRLKARLGDADAGRALRVPLGASDYRPGGEPRLRLRIPQSVRPPSVRSRGLGPGKDQAVRCPRRAQVLLARIVRENAPEPDSAGDLHDATSGGHRLPARAGRVGIGIVRTFCDDRPEIPPLRRTAV